MQKTYLELNVNQRINAKFTADLFRRGYIGNNENIYIFIFSQYDKIGFPVYSSIPIRVGLTEYKNSQAFFTI